MREFVIILIVAAGMFFYGYLVGKDIQKRKLEKNALHFDNRADMEAFLDKFFEEIEKGDSEK